MKYLYFTKADKKFIIENIRKRAWEMMDNTRRKKMSLEVAIGLVLIVAFVVTIFKRWFSPYAALVFVPLVCGLVYCAMSGQSLLTVFDWIYDGVFYAC